MLSLLISPKLIPSVACLWSRAEDSMYRVRYLMLSVLNKYVMYVGLLKKVQCPVHLKIGLNQWKHKCNACLDSKNLVWITTYTKLSINGNTQSKICATFLVVNSISSNYLYLHTINDIQFGEFYVHSNLQWKMKAVLSTVYTTSTCTCIKNLYCLHSILVASHDTNYIPVVLSFVFISKFLTWTYFTEVIYYLLACWSLCCFVCSYRWRGDVPSGGSDRVLRGGPQWWGQHDLELQPTPSSLPCLLHPNPLQPAPELPKPLPGQTDTGRWRLVRMVLLCLGPYLSFYYIKVTTVIIQIIFMLLPGNGGFFWNPNILCKWKLKSIKYVIVKLYRRHINQPLL